MFSKFFCGKSEETLAALEVQWRTEYARAQRKFRNAAGKKKAKGRLPLSHLNLNVLNSGTNLDLSELARKIATTRDGQRAHKSAAKKISKGKQNGVRF